MKKITKFLFFALIATAASSCVDVASNNQAANGGLQKTSVKENSNAANENSAVLPETEATSTNSETAAGENLSPEKLVEDLYNQHDNENSPFFQDQNREKLDRYFVKNLADSIWKDSTTSKGEVGALDFDPLYNAQDTEIAEFNIGKPVVTGDKAEVIVTFTNFGEKQMIKYMLSKEKGVWKIEDIDYGENSTLVKVFKENN